MLRAPDSVAPRRSRDLQLRDLPNKLFDPERLGLEFQRQPRQTGPHDGHRPSAPSSQRDARTVRSIALLTDSSRFHPPRRRPTRAPAHNRRSHPSTSLAARLLPSQPPRRCAVASRRRARDLWFDWQSRACVHPPALPVGSRTTAELRRTAPVAGGSTPGAVPLGTEVSVCPRHESSGRPGRALPPARVCAALALACLRSRGHVRDHLGVAAPAWAPNGDSWAPKPWAGAIGPLSAQAAAARSSTERSWAHEP